MELSKCWKMIKLSKIAMKLKNGKTFYEGQTASRV